MRGTLGAMYRTVRRRIRKRTKKFIHNRRRSWTVLRSRFDSRSSDAPARLLNQIQQGVFAGYHFDGTPCSKNPFDLALYTKLLSELRPKTIIEIGSAAGGSGKWFAAQLKGLGVDGMVYSFDINPVTGLDSDNLKFGKADIFNLAESDLSKILENCERPLLVVEDGPHTFEGCLAALEFFRDYLSKGEYYVVEDGNLMELGYYELKNGPKRAINQFLTSNSAFEIDYSYCDFFGRNVTWNHNGWLRVAQ